MRHRAGIASTVSELAKIFSRVVIRPGTPEKIVQTKCSDPARMQDSLAFGVPKRS
jgi:hypothetical protein